MDITYTIIIPHKDIPDLLQRCLDAIPQRVDVQVIVVDDNSNPDKVDFVQFPGLDRTNTECYFTKEGKGAGYARNVGLQHARGKWLLFADADDFFHDGMLDMLDKWKDSDSEIVFFNYNSVDCDTLKPLGTRFVCRRTEDELRYVHGCPWSKIIDRNFVTKNNILFDECCVNNDTMFSLKSGHLASKVSISDDILYCSTERKGSLCYRFGIDVLLNRLWVNTRCNRFFYKHDLRQYYHSPISLLCNIHQSFGIIVLFKALNIYFQYEPVVFIGKDIEKYFGYKYRGLKARLNNYLHK